MDKYAVHFCHSLLFSPANKSKYFSKTQTIDGAGGVIFDLEDAAGLG